MTLTIANTELNRGESRLARTLKDLRIEEAEIIAHARGEREFAPTSSRTLAEIRNDIELAEHAHAAITEELEELRTSLPTADEARSLIEELKAAADNALPNIEDTGRQLIAAYKSHLHAVRNYNGEIATIEARISAAGIPDAGAELDGKRLEFSKTDFHLQHGFKPIVQEYNVPAFALDIKLRHLHDETK